MHDSPIEAFVRGFGLPLRGLDLLLASRGVKRYAALPLLCNAVLYAAAIAAGVVLIWNWRIEVAWDFWGPVGAWLSTTATYFLGALKWLTFVPAVAIVCYFSFTSVGMIVAAPFNELLSEKLEERICNRPAPVPLRLDAMALGVLDALRLAAAQVLCTLAALPFVLVPVLGAVPLFLVTAWFTGVGFLDTAMARHYLRRRHKRPVLRCARWEILGMGVAMQLLFLIPFLGLLILPVGVASGTIGYCAHDWERILARAGIEPPPGYGAPCNSR